MGLPVRCPCSRKASMANKGLTNFLNATMAYLLNKSRPREGLRDAASQAAQQAVEIDMCQCSISTKKHPDATVHLRSLFQSPHPVKINNGTIEVDPANPLVVTGDVNLDHVEIVCGTFKPKTGQQGCLLMVREKGHLQLNELEIHRQGPEDTYHVCGVKVCAGYACTRPHHLHATPCAAWPLTAGAMRHADHAHACPTQQHPAPSTRAFCANITCVLLPL